MIIIGEKINATRKAVARALREGDDAHIAQVARQQAEAGANYLDVNGGDPRAGKEADNIAWLMDIVQAHTDLPVAVDTADAEAAKRGLSRARKKPILNSVSLESARLETHLPLLGEHECMVIALLMSDEGPPKGVDDRLKTTEALIEKITSTGKKQEEIIVDPCFFPVSSDTTCGRGVIDAVAAIHRRWPEVHVGGGVSNISYGLPKRRFVNAAALAQAIYNGLDAAIVDPGCPGIMATIFAADAVAGRDDFCMNYVTAHREGKLE